MSWQSSHAFIYYYYYYAALLFYPAETTNRKFGKKVISLARRRLGPNSHHRPVFNLDQGGEINFTSLSGPKSPDAKFP